MDFGLKGKVAVVTGGTEGIGRATALRLAAEGAKLAICARGQEKLDKTATEIGKTGAEVLAVAADMSKAADVERFMKAVVERFGRIDILVNNAGTSMRGKFLELQDKAWSDDIELKVFGAIRCTRLAAPHWSDSATSKSTCTPAPCSAVANASSSRPRSSICSSRCCSGRVA